MSLLGIYFGPKSINIVDTKGKKVLHNIAIPQTTISTGELEEKVPSEVKTIEVIALIKEELRRNKIDSREAALCLSGKDLIIRTFEIPVLPREELQSAINFEAKKYIPFKVEELITDFQVKLDKSSNTNLVLFVGIKRETFDRYVSILNQLDINMAAIEYSAFSLLRLMRGSGLKEKGIIATLSADIAGDDEINFAVLEDDFPLFSRDISLALAPREPSAAAEETGGFSQAIEKLKSEIRASLDYYHRKFPAKNIKKLYLLCGNDYRMELESFMTEIGLAVSFFDTSKHVDSSLPYSLSFIKAYGASLPVKTDIRIDLLAARERIKAPKEKDVRLEAASLLKGLHLDYRIVSLGVLICAATFIYGIYRSVPLNKRLDEIVKSRLNVVSAGSGASYTALSDVNSKLKKKLTVLDNLVKKQLYVTLPLEAVPQVLPNGLWLSRFTFNKTEEGSPELELGGMVYLNDSNQEFETVNQFLSSLKENDVFRKYFTDINIVSVSRGRFESLNVTNFSISCKNYKGAS